MRFYKLKERRKYSPLNHFSNYSYQHDNTTGSLCFYNNSAFLLTFFLFSLSLATLVLINDYNIATLVVAFVFYLQKVLLWVLGMGGWIMWVLTC